jgi:hypothetical protein
MQGQQEIDPFRLAIRPAHVEGYLLAGRTAASIFVRRINRPCSNQPCPYGLVGLALLDSPQEACDAYVERARLPEERVATFGLHVFRISVSAAASGVPAASNARWFFSELHDGPPTGRAWDAVRHHVDHDRLDAVVFPNLMPIKVLVPVVRSAGLVEAERLGPAFDGLD